MKNELEDKLFKKYPKLFRQKDLSMKETCMNWGCECGDGWHDLIDRLCFYLQFDIDRNGEPQIEFIQVKEKFGSLRMYTSGESDKQYGVISFAEFLSESICERCGSNHNVKQTEGWISTLCEKCMEEK